VLDSSDGVVLDHRVHIGNPADGPLLVPAIARLKALVGRAPKAVTADRGCGDDQIDKDLKAPGVAYVAIVPKGRPTRQRSSDGLGDSRDAVGGQCSVQPGVIGGDSSEVMLSPVAVANGSTALARAQS
jgi:hypothetical protein